MEEDIIAYFLIISMVTVLFTVYDKLASKKLRKHRVPEKVLITLAVIGGSVAELLTMLIIRHKTKHKKFMIGLPVIIIIQVAVAIIIRNM